MKASARPRPSLAGGRKSSHLRSPLLILLAVFTLLLASCGSDGSDGASGGDDTSTEATGGGDGGDGGDKTASGGSDTAGLFWVNKQTDLPEVTEGGVLKIAMSAPPSSLSPSDASMSGATGGAILSAIYDVLVRWDPDAGEFVPKLAESLEPNDDATVWTLKLRPDIRFTDGTTLDAEAVLATMEDQKTPTADASGVIGMIDSMRAEDDLTVVFELSEPWARFPNIFTSGGGMVISPTALEERGDGFKTDPVGAGPFMVESFDPASELMLTRNPDYWGGDVPLDGIHVTWSSDQSVNLDKLTTGQVDLIFTNVFGNANKAIDEGLPGYVTPVGGSAVLINNRDAADTGFPGDDPRLRRALASVMDYESLNIRVSDGRGLYGASILPQGADLGGTVPTAIYDPELAEQLVQEVKDDTGWDGKVTLLAPGEISSSSVAGVLQAQFNSIGLDVEYDAVADYTDLVQKIVIDRNFQLAVWQISTYPEDPWDGLFRGLKSASMRNYSGFENDEFDALLADLQAAQSDEETIEAVEALSEFWQQEQPNAFYGALPFSAFWRDDVHGVQPTAKALLLFDEVFLDR